MARTRITILWTIVIVFISQLFHCAYTNQRDQGLISTAPTTSNSGSSNKPASTSQGLNHHQLTQQHSRQLQQQQAQPQLPRTFDYEQPLQRRGPQAASITPQPRPVATLSSDHHHDADRETYEELLGSSSGASFDDLADAQAQQQQQVNLQPPVATSGARERCRELINLPLLSFSDLMPDERASDEIECAHLREQIAGAAAAAANRPRNQAPPQQRQRSRPQQATPLELPLDPAQPVADGAGGADEQPLEQAGPNSGSNPLVVAGAASATSGASSQLDEEQEPTIKLKNGQLVATRGRQFQPLLISDLQNGVAADQQFNNSSSFAGWPPRSSYATQLQQMLLQQQHSPRRPQNQAQARQITTTALTTTFEPQFETTPYPTTTTTTTPAPKRTTTTTTTTIRPSPKIRVAGGPGGGRRRQGGRAMGGRSTTTTTTTTTTTQKPSTQADYADGSDLSTDYYDEYDDQQQATTTTTTTSRPNRRNGGGGRRQGGRRFRQQTTPKPTTTTTTTLSPGYQQRPDGRIIDYMADPNFPRELKGADLTNYPFYINVPDKINFDCKGRHDGYYTNIDLYCQIYHHCAVGNRYDFLCPNYTLFDQTTFTCRFINTVDCPGSEKHFDRNNALYVEKDDKSSSSSLTTSTTTTTTTTTTQAPRLNLQLSPRNGGSGSGQVSGLAIIKSSRPVSGIAPSAGGSNRNRRATGNGDANYSSRRRRSEDSYYNVSLVSFR